MIDLAAWYGARDVLLLAGLNRVESGTSEWEETLVFEGTISS